MKLIEKLKFKLDLSFNETWGNRGQIRYEIHDVSDKAQSEELVTDIKFFIKTRSGNEELIMQNSIGMISNETELNDFLAETLSKLLENHMKWPR